ncbi:MAG: hypothetical protein K9J13_03005 [Saprospiraceae bacterium]|nr:hypothetical protein [Saprospiraceae bacterium]
MPCETIFNIRFGLLINSHRYNAPETALRDIQDLISKQILRKEDAGGRSTNYELAEV